MAGTVLIQSLFSDCSIVYSIFEVTIMERGPPAASIIGLVHANEEPDVRSAEITLKSSVQNYTIQVRQLGYGPAILVKNPNPIIDAARLVSTGITSDDCF